MGLLVAALPKVILGRNKYTLETLVPFLWLSDHGNSGTQETRISVGIFSWKKLRLEGSQRRTVYPEEESTGRGG